MAPAMISIVDSAVLVGDIATPRVMITCPDFGKRVYTGPNLDWSALEALGEEEHSFRCPSCGTTHKLGP